MSLLNPKEGNCGSFGESCVLEGAGTGNSLSKSEKKKKLQRCVLGGWGRGWGADRSEWGPPGSVISVTALPSELFGRKSGSISEPRNEQVGGRQPAALPTFVPGCPLPLCMVTFGPPCLLKAPLKHFPTPAGRLWEAAQPWL